MNKSVSGKTRSSLYWNTLLKIPYEIFRFGTSIIVARILGPKDFGIVSIATMAIYYSNTLTSFGFNQALVQRAEITNKHLDSVFTINLLISVFMTFAFIAFAPHIAIFFNSPESNDVIKVLASIFILTAVSDIPYTILRRNIDFKLISIIYTVRDVAMSVITLALALYGLNYWSIVYGQLIPMVFVLAYLLYKVEWIPKLYYHHKSIKDLFVFSIWSFVQMQISFFSSRIDRIIVGKYLSPITLGFYEKAKSLTQMPSENITFNINSVLFSSFSRVQNDKDETRKILFNALLLISVINFPIYIGLIVISKYFVFILLGQKWTQIINTLKIMSIGGIFAALNGLFSTIIVSSGYNRVYSIILAFSTIILFIGSLVLSNYGMNYVAIGFVIYQIILLCLSYTIIKDKHSIRLSDIARSIYPAFISTLCMFIVIILLVQLKNEVTIYNMLLIIFSGFAVYTITLWYNPNENVKKFKANIITDLKTTFFK